MSSRLVRRHHEAASRAAGPSEPSGISDEEDDELAPTSRQRSVFALLEEDSEDNDELDEAASTAAASEHATTTIPTESGEAEPLAASTPSPTPHASQKGKRHGKKTRKSPNNDEDEDLLAVPPLGRASESVTSGMAPEPPPLDPWRLSALHVDVSNELARRFDRQTLRQAAAAEPGPRGHEGGIPRKSKRPRRALGRA